MAWFSFGAGPPLVLVPGIQGRWEWMRPAVDALAHRFRVLTYSLAGERSSGVAFGPDRGFDAHVSQLEAILDEAGGERATVCGVSFGGLIAVRFAAVLPHRVDRLVLVSAPAPTWRPEARVERYASAPRTSAIAFVAGAPGRLWREIVAAVPGRRRRWKAAASYLWAVAANPASPVRMAARVRCLGGHDFVRDAVSVVAPALVITGEPSLDRVVPVTGTREYLDLIPAATGHTLARTGHIGLVTRPEAFADAVFGFCFNRS